jgi:hypothetical protein
MNYESEFLYNTFEFNEIIETIMTDSMLNNLTIKEACKRADIPYQKFKNMLAINDAAKTTSKEHSLAQIKMMAETITRELIAIVS